MKKSLFRLPLVIFGLLILIFVFIAAVGAPSGVLALPAQRSNQLSQLSANNNTCDVISAQEDSVALTSSQQPWTIARMQAAQPYPIPSNEFNSSSAVDPQLPAGDPVYIPSAPPEDYSPASPAQIPGTFSAESLLGYTYPAPYTRFENFDDYKVFPYSTTGVLFFSQNGKDFRCSAASIGNNSLWTAGHCVHDGSGTNTGWSTNLIFVPAYKDGNMPFGSWTSNDDVATCSGWRDNGNFQVDFGGVLLEENSSSKTVDEIVGSLGFAFNLTPIQHWFSLGYPLGFPFDGKTMQICAASFARNDPQYNFPSPMAIGCDMTGGSSGGPWILDFSGAEGNSNYINGNNSYRYVGFGEEMYSPYFGEQAKELLDFLSTETSIKTNFYLPIITTNE